MKLKLTESQFDMLPMDGKNDLEIYRNTSSQAIRTLNGIYLDFTSTSISEILDGSIQIGNIHNSVDDIETTIRKMRDRLKNKLEFDDSLKYDEELYANAEDELDNILSPVYKKTQAISDMIYGLKSIYSKLVEETDTPIGELFSDIKSFEV